MSPTPARDDGGRELEPCPFCGRSDALRLTGLSIGMSGSRNVYCNSEKGGCGSTGPSFRFGCKMRSESEAMEHAASAWNESALRSELAAMRAQVELARPVMEAACAVCVCLSDMSDSEPLFADSKALARLQRAVSALSPDKGEAGER